MEYNVNHIKYFKYYIYLITLCSIIPRIYSVLSFTYPQSTTLSNNNILIVEKNGIYICNPSLNTIISTVFSFSDEDKILSETDLSKTIIKKSSYAILVFSNYKIYMINTNTGELLYNSDNKLFYDEPEYISLTYTYGNNVDNFYFYIFIAYIDDYNYLQIKKYKYFKDDQSIILQYYYSLNSVGRTIDSYYNTLSIQNKGLSCDNLVDYTDNTISYLTCFVIVSDDSEDYLIPIIFDDQSTSISNLEDDYEMDYINVNGNKQIKSDTNIYMDIDYVCYVTEANIATCYKFFLDSYFSEGYFESSSEKIFTKNCRADIYGMKVNYIFETNDIVFSCSDSDGSLQAYIFDETNNYLKYENCDNIYGFSIIYLTDLNNYYIISDVNCPEGKIPYDILIPPTDHVPEIVGIDTTNKETTVDSTETTKSENTILSDKNRENTYYENIVSKSTEKTSNKITDKIEIVKTEKNTENVEVTNTAYKDNPKKSNIIDIDIFEKTDIVNDCPEMCLECNSQNQCTKCNQNKNYYPIYLTPISSTFNLVECITESTKQIKYPNFYLDTETKSFKSCYECCSTCYGKGDGNNNNCKTCETGYIINPEYPDSKNCVPKPNSLYYIKYGQYTLTNSDRCPDDFSFLIKIKGKCIEQCQKDNKYKYTYDGLCYEMPPENTNDDDNDYICKDIPNKCIITKKELYTLNETITDDEIEKLISKYAKEYNYTNNHISIYENNIYIITIYKNGECISELGVLSKIINFENCYSEIQTKNALSLDTNLIIVNIETKSGKESYKKSPTYALYHPVTGKSLHYEEECKDKKITIQNNLTEELNNSKVSLDDIKTMADQGIDLFDLYSPFYSDLCTHYPEVINKDIPLKKRILAYYPDIELCDDNCDLLYVFLNNLTSKCECVISQESDKKNKIKDNAIYKSELEDLEEFIYLTNINVIKCYKDVFKYKYFVKCYGGFIILGLILVQIICTFVYFTKSKFFVKKYIFSITNKYLNYLLEKKQFNDLDQKPDMIKDGFDKIYFPPRKQGKSQTGIGIFVKKQNQHNNSNLLAYKNHNSRDLKNTNLNSDMSNKKLNLNHLSTKRIDAKNGTLQRKSSNMTSPKLSFQLSASDNLMNNINDNDEIYIEEFLETDPQNMDYDDALRRDKRTFCKYYSDKIQSEQIILNTFFNEEPLKPIPIKIILLLLQIDLYFFINGLFYNEEYVTKKFELEKDSFSKQAWRFLDNLFYAFIVGVIINYIIEFFFVEEKKLRVTLKREKSNILILKYEMTQIIKDIEKRYLSFIIVNFIIVVFIWYYITCFNNIYPHMKKEWLIFSVLIIVCIQIISLIKSLIETILRFLSFKFKNEKLFKLSLLFS